MSDSFAAQNPQDNAPQKPATPRAVPSTQPGWIDIFLGTLVAPRQTFRLLSEREPVQSNFAGACMAVLLVFLLDGVRDLSAKTLEFAAFTIPMSLIGGVVTWLAVAGAVGLAGLAFGQPRYKFGAIVSTMGWSFLPWLFMGPVCCLQNLLGNATALFALAPAIWVFVLQLTAIGETYDLKLWQTLCLALVVPMLIWLSQLSQTLHAIGAVFGATT